LVTKHQIAGGIAEYMRAELLPKMGKNKALQIGLSVAADAVKSNDAMIDKVLGHEMVRTFLRDDGNGHYEIGELMDSLKKSVEQYGDLPIDIPVIPIFAPQGGTVTLSADDISAIRKKIEDWGN
jgi:hypothetical protein